MLNSKKNKKCVLCAGGTGGHLFPAFALRKGLIEQGCTIKFITDSRGARFFPSQNLTPDLICTIKRKSSFLGKLIYPLSLLSQLIKCMIWFLKENPSVVMGFGGYPSFPGVFAAQLLRIPTLIHEGNAFLGKANRFLSKRAQKVALSFEPSSSSKDSRYITTGMPIREAIQQLALKPYAAPEQDEIFKIMVMGGSQGAKIFSTSVPIAIKNLSVELQKRIHITQQCREELLQETNNLYSQTHCQFRLETFLNPIEKYYEDTHFIISRSGASSVAELCVIGKPCLLVPFQAAVEGDQFANAKYLLNRDAVWMMTEKEMLTEKLKEFFEMIIKNPDVLNQKSQKLRMVSFPKAVKTLCNIVAEMA